MLQTNETTQSHPPSKTVGKGGEEEAAELTFSDILSTLSDRDCFAMFKQIAEHKGPRVESLDTPKKFYGRLKKLKKTALIKREDMEYKTTTLGTVLCNILKTAEVASSLSWRLMAIDAMDDINNGNNKDNGKTREEDERQEVIKMLIPDEAIQRILLQQKAIK